VPLVLFTLLVVGRRNVDSPKEAAVNFRLGGIGGILIGIGSVAALVLGIVLAIDSDDYHPWDGWVIAAIVLWLIAAVALFRSFVEYAKPVAKAKELIASGLTGPNDELTALNRTSTGLLLRGLASAAIVLIVIDMIYKPGA